MKKIVLIIFFNLVIQTYSMQDTPIWYPNWHKAMLSSSKGYKRKYERNKEALDLCYTRYQEGNPTNLDPINSIPKIFHAIWVGPRAIPPLFIKCQETWKKEFPEWDYILWTNERVEQEILPFFSEEHRQIYFNGNPDHREKADILRLYILKHYGGFYIDGDMSCINPEALKELFQYYDFLVGMSCPGNPEIVNNAIIGSTPHHDIINYLIENLKNIEVEKWVFRSGVFFFSKQFCKIFPYARGRNIALPSTIFYALPYKHSHNRPISYYLKPWSLVIHHWANSSNVTWRN